MMKVSQKIDGEQIDIPIYDFKIYTDWTVWVSKDSQTIYEWDTDAYIQYRYRHGIRSGAIPHIDCVMSNGKLIVREKDKLISHWRCTINPSSPEPLRMNIHDFTKRDNGQMVMCYMDFMPAMIGLSDGA